MLMKSRLKAELESNKKRELDFDSGKKQHITMDIECYWCKKYLNIKDARITNEDVDYYYQCKFHHTIFCYTCAWNSYKEEVDSHLAPKCRQNPFKLHIDCIYDKKEIV